MIDTKLLRQKILDLAIRGKLVPQDPNDEPASELLKRIKAEKEALIKAGKIKRDKHESYIFRGEDKRYYEQIDGKTNDITEEIPFDLPQGWEWCRIGYIGIMNPRNRIPDDTMISFMPMTQLESGYGSAYTFSEKLWKDVKTGFTHFQENDVVFAKITPCFQNRKSAVMRGLKNGYGAGTKELHVIRCFSSVLPDYVLLFVKNKTFISDAVATIQGVVGQQRIDAIFVKSYFIPIPPHAEQIRIVERIKALLNNVDEIDQSSETMGKTISLAKQKILDLAIRGKLVPQNPDDEPASELLRKIKIEKEALIKAGKLKRDKHESFIFKGDDNCYYEQTDGKTVEMTEEIPFELPESWIWCRVGTLCNYGVCQSSDSDEIPENAWILDLEDIEKDTGRLLSRIIKQDRPTTSSKHIFHKGNVLFSKLRTYLNKVLIADQDGFCTSEILPLDFGKYILPEYARCVMMSKMFLDYTARCGYGVKMPRLGTEDGRNALFPLPPLTEQQRIILKLNCFKKTLSLE